MIEVAEPIGGLHERRPAADRGVGQTYPVTGGAEAYLLLGRARGSRPAGGGDAIEVDRLGDVLEFALAEIDERGGHLALDLAMGLARDTQSARLGGLLQTRGDVNTVAENIAVLNHDVAQVDPDSEDDSLVVTSGHRVLDRDGATDGVDDAGELGQEPIAHRLNDAAAVLGDRGVDHLGAARLEARQRPRLVGADESAVADHVGTEDCRQPPFGHAGSQVA